MPTEWRTQVLNSLGALGAEEWGGVVDDEVVVLLGSASASCTKVERALMAFLGCSCLGVWGLGEVGGVSRLGIARLRLSRHLFIYIYIYNPDPPSSSCPLTSSSIPKAIVMRPSISPTHACRLAGCVRRHSLTMVPLLLRASSNLETSDGDCWRVEDGMAIVEAAPEFP